MAPKGQRCPHGEKQITQSKQLPLNGIREFRYQIRVEGQYMRRRKPRRFKPHPQHPFTAFRCVFVQSITHGNPVNIHNRIPARIRIRKRMIGFAVDIAESVFP